ncbi:MAG: hypothetical protein AB7S75_05580 [Desulfococcaceae bacterium]
MAQENDIVLIYFENNPIVFARIESILPDIKPDWYHVKLLMLQVPPQPVTWILRNAYINGDEFTMNGKLIRMELVVCPEDREMPEEREEREEKPKKEGSGKGSGKVISLSSRRKR